MRGRKEILAELALLALCSKESHPEISFANMLSSYRSTILAHEDFELLNQKTQKYPKIFSFAVVLLEDLYLFLTDIDQVLSVSSDGWRIDRMSLVVRSLLRLGIYLFISQQKTFILDSELPMKDAEIFRLILGLAKRYSEEGSSAFIHAVLEKSRKKLMSDKKIN